MIFCPFLSKWYPLFWSWTKNTMDKNRQKWTIMDKNRQKINTNFNHFGTFSSNSTSVFRMISRVVGCFKIDFRNPRPVYRHVTYHVAYISFPALCSRSFPLYVNPFSEYPYPLFRGIQGVPRGPVDHQDLTHLNHVTQSSLGLVRTICYFKPFARYLYPLFRGS